MATGDFALTLPQMREAASLHQHGYSPRQIGSHFGKSRTAVRNALRFMDVPSRDRIEASAQSNRKRARATSPAIPLLPKQRDQFHLAAPLAGDASRYENRAHSTMPSARVIRSHK